MVKRMTAFTKLQSDREVALCNDRGLVALCDAVLGEDWRCSADGGQDRQRFVELMVWALTRLAYRYRLYVVAP